jgi:hypothetical protein
MTHEVKERELGRIVEGICKEKTVDISEKQFYVGGRKGITLLTGSQSLPARPRDKDRMKIKTLGWF